MEWCAGLFAISSFAIIRLMKRERVSFAFVKAILACACCMILPSYAVERDAFQIRDPFVVAENGVYYLYESKPWSGGDGVFVRTSRDLATWTEKKRVMSIPDGVDCTAVWAPEVHKYRGKYYLFATITEKDGTREIRPMAEGVEPGRLHPRGTWIFSSERPEGPFLPVSNGPATPKDWVSLDGTLVVEDGKPYMVFCHEWVQTKIGRMCYAPLKDDLSGFAGEPKIMFAAADAMPGAGRVTDGPFFLRSEKSGALHMIWSNMVKGKGYCVLQRTSASGKLAGPWTEDSVLFGRNGGHGMVFRTFDGRLMLTLHQPNKTPDERMKLFEIEDAGHSLRIKKAKNVLVRVKDQKVVDEALEIRSRPYPIKLKSHAYRALEAGAEYVETGAVLGDAFDIPLHDFGVKMIFNCTNLVDVQAAVELGAKYIRTSDPEGVKSAISRLYESYRRPVHRSEFRIRDPYVFADPETKTYYLYETKSPYFDVPFARGVNVRTSKDLETWSPLKEVMSVPTNLRCRTVWAPEVHRHKGSYYLFTTLSFHPSPDDNIPIMTDDPNWKPKDNLGLVRRGTWVYRAESPLGPFLPVSDGSATPKNWMAIDGSLLVDNEKPYMVFCHEWPQTKWGRIDIAEMSQDLSRFVGEPKVLFESRAAGPGAGHVTDGCFCYRSPKTGKLYMIWSPFYNRNYTVFSCESATGRAEGPWINQKMIFEKNGGHGMLFRTFEGQLKLVIHQPERRGYERIAFFDVDDTDSGLVVRQPK